MVTIIRNHLHTCAAFISFKSFGLCGHYSRAATIRGRRIFEEIQYTVLCRLLSCTSIALPHTWWASYVLHRPIRCLCIYEAHMSPALNESSAIWCFKCSNVIENTQRNNLRFYTGLPHMHVYVAVWSRNYYSVAYFDRVITFKVL